TLAERTTRSRSTKKRGAWRRTRRSFRVTTSAVALPTWALEVQPRVVARQVVRLSGQVKVTVALPRASVTTEGVQKAVSAKFVRAEAVTRLGVCSLCFPITIPLAYCKS